MRERERGKQSKSQHVVRQPRQRQRQADKQKKCSSIRDCRGKGGSFLAKKHTAACGLYRLGQRVTQNSRSSACRLVVAAGQLERYQAAIIGSFAPKCRAVAVTVGVGVGVAEVMQ